MGSLPKDRMSTETLVVCSCGCEAAEIPEIPANLYRSTLVETA